MSKVILLRIINPLLLLVFFVQACTGIIFSLKIHMDNMLLIAQIHDYNGWLMIVLIVSHVILNWGWIRANIFKKKQIPPVQINQANQKNP
jgi:hypothetical protein